VVVFRLNQFTVVVFRLNQFAVVCLPIKPVHSGLSSD
jgi:hypothetical protein